MPQRWVPAVFMRGGTSKGLFIHAEDLPPDQAGRDRLLLAALGSPTRSAASSTGWAAASPHCPRRP
jgi:2-methylaconitate cis-trans-isomerase PrpF